MGGYNKFTGFGRMLDCTVHCIVRILQLTNINWFHMIRLLFVLFDLFQCLNIIGLLAYWNPISQCIHMDASVKKINNNNKYICKENLHNNKNSFCFHEFFLLKMISREKMFE